MSTNPKKRNKQAPAAPARAAQPRPQRTRQKQKKPPMMAIRIVLYGIVAFVVARRNRNKTGGATAGPLTALANRLFGGRTGDAAGAPAAGGAAAGAGAAAPQTARRPADESEGDEFDD